MVRSVIIFEDMNKLLRATRHLRIEEILTVIYITVVSLINFLMFNDSISGISSVKSVIRYFNFGESLFYIFFFLVILYFLWNLINALSLIITRHLISKNPMKRSEILGLSKFTWKALRSMLPIIFVPAVASTLLSHLNFSLRFTNYDLLFASIDHTLIGSYVFLDLPLFISDIGQADLVFYSYILLPVIIGILLIALYIKRPATLYREMIIAFLLSMAVSFPFFALFPCIGPNNYFIRNLHNNSAPEAIASRLQGFDPGEKIRKYTAQVADAQTIPGPDHVVPISAFPSMHTIWGMLVVYYCFRVRRTSLFVTIPWILFMLAGGLMLGQHYVIDYVAAIPFIIIIISLSRMLMKRYGSLGTPLRTVSFAATLKQYTQKPAP